MQLKNRIDQPIKIDSEDKLNINIYKDGLIQYLHNCETPMTISIQGEWGSGKTSLLNLIAHELQNNNYIININTWYYSFFQEHEVPVKVFMDLLNELEKIDVNLKTSFEKHKLTFLKIGRAAAKLAAVKFVGEGGETAVDEMDVFASKEIEEIKNSIEQGINNLLQKNQNKSKIIFLIDDLDRLNPELSVKILEVLKNIFDCKGSIFILAIDYDVIVKGLYKKFGDYEKNEREYRQFFDKIVQLPFSMPMQNYTLDVYLKEQLSAVEYFDENKYLEDKTNLKYLTKISTLTVGKNPRAIKRVVNYLSLLDSIIETDKDNTLVENEKKALQFALISIQVAYPQIYKLLAKEANFLEWTDTILENISEIDFNDITIGANNELVDEEWEQTLYSYIKGINNKFLNSRIIYILECFNEIRKHLGDEKIKEYIEEMMLISSVTSPTINIITSHKSNYSKIWIEINKYIPEIDPNRRSATSNKIELIQNISFSISIRQDSMAIFVDFKKSAKKHRNLFERLKDEENNERRVVYVINKEGNDFDDAFIKKLKNQIEDIKRKLKN